MNSFKNFKQTLSLLIFGLILFSFSSCEKDEGLPENSSWNAQIMILSSAIGDFTLDGILDLNINGADFTADYSINSSNEKFSFSGKVNENTLTVNNETIVIIHDLGGGMTGTETIVFNFSATIDGEKLTGSGDFTVDFPEAQINGDGLVSINAQQRN